MQHKPIGVQITPTRRYETEVDKRFKEIIDSLNNASTTIPHFDNIDQVNIDEGNFATVSNGEDLSLYRKVNNKLMKVV